MEVELTRNKMHIDLEAVYELPITEEFGKLLFGKTFFREDCKITQYKNEGETQIEWVARYAEDHKGERTIREMFAMRDDGTIMRMTDAYTKGRIMEAMPCYRALQILEYISQNI